MGHMMGAYGDVARPVESTAGETMLLWGLDQPMAHCNNALVRQAGHSLDLDACGRRLSLLQSPSTPSSSSAPPERSTSHRDADSLDVWLLSDLPDRLKLLRKKVHLNVAGDDPHVPGSARVTELV